MNDEKAILRLIERLEKQVEMLNSMRDKKAKRGNFYGAVEADTKAAGVSLAINEAYAFIGSEL